MCVCVRACVCVSVSVCRVRVRACAPQRGLGGRSGSLGGVAAPSGSLGGLWRARVSLYSGLLELFGPMFSIRRSFDLNTATLICSLDSGLRELCGGGPAGLKLPRRVRGSRALRAPVRDERYGTREAVDSSRFG